MWDGFVDERDGEERLASLRGGLATRACDVDALCETISDPALAVPDDGEDTEAHALPTLGHTREAHDFEVLFLIVRFDLHVAWTATAATWTTGTATTAATPRTADAAAQRLRSNESCDGWRAACAAALTLGSAQEVQSHGLVFERWVRDTFFDGYKPASYTQRWDIPAAANRAQQCITDYRDVPATEEALFILYKSYDALGMEQLRDDAKRVLEKNFPQSDFLLKGGKANSDPWWKIW